MTVVLLHPIGLDARCWQFVLHPRLADAVRYDLLWHGGREKPESPLTIRSFAEDVVVRVPGRLDLVGASMGGAVALEIALNWPERVRSLLLACSSPGGNGTAMRARADDTDRTGMEAMVDPTLRRWFSTAALNRPNHPGVAYARDRLMSDSPEAFAASWRALAEHDAWSRLHLIAAPATVLRAADDASVPREIAQSMASKMRGPRLAVIPGPHMAQLEEWDSFEAATLEHLDWVDSRVGQTEETRESVERI